MPLFGRASDDGDPVTQRLVAWVDDAAASELAAELMPIFADYEEVERKELVAWLFREAPGMPSVKSLNGPLLEALQVLQNAELVYLSYTSDYDVRRWRATRFGLQTLEEGQESVRQRIVERFSG